MNRGFTSPRGRWRPFSGARHPSHLHLHHGGRGGVVVHHHRGAMRRSGPSHGDCPQGRVRCDRSSRRPDARCVARRRRDHVGGIRPRSRRVHGAGTGPCSPRVRAAAADRTRLVAGHDRAVGTRSPLRRFRPQVGRRSRSARSHVHEAGSRPRPVRGRDGHRIRPAASHVHEAGNRPRCLRGTDGQRICLVAGHDRAVGTRSPPCQFRPQVGRRSRSARSPGHAVGTRPRPVRGRGGHRTRRAERHGHEA
jgi:hypothetical protein